VLRSLLRFARHLAGRRRALAVVFALGLAGAAVSLATPLLGMAFVDAVATRGDFAAIPPIAAALIALSLADFALATFTGRVHARLSADVLADLRGELFARCVDAPLERIEPLRHGDLLTRFGTDIARIETLLVDGALGALSNILFLGVAAVITFALSPPLALWSFAGVLLAVALASAFRQPIERRSRRVRGTMVDLSHFLSERLSGLRAIRLHGTQRDEKESLAAHSDRLSREVVGYHVLESIAAGVPGLALTLSLAWIYIAGGRLLETGAITLGTFVAFVLYQGRLFAPANGLVALLRHLQEARVAVARVDEVLGRDVAVTASERTATHADAAIVLDGVTFAYPGKAPVFRGVDLRIEPGERVALFGASGAGKSTLVQLLFGLREPLEGRVSIAGGSPHDPRCAPALGYAGAEPFLMHATIEDNVRYGNPHARGDDVERALALADAAAFVAALPDGDRTIVGGRGLALSDGQRQRLGLARLFLRDPRIVVLDEAFCALDLDTEMRIRRNLWKALGEHTALVVSHRPVGLADFDRLLVLREGRFVEASADEVRSFASAAIAGAAQPRVPARHERRRASPRCSPAPRGGEGAGQEVAELGED
jgi:ABC-type multidrug transport system fused ATPase/permease subunit